MHQLIDKAARFAAVKHDGQYRKGTNIPYITHPFGVAMILMEESQSEKLVVAALLHDTLEDTEATEEELFRNFGEEILMLVMAASEPDKSQAWEIRKQHTIDELPHHSIDALNLILADKLHNLRSVQTDALKHGSGIWNRFNRGKREQCWYYMGIIHAVKGRKREINLIRKLEEEVIGLFIGKKRLTLHDVRTLFHCAHLSAEQGSQELQDSGLAEFVAELWKSAEAIYIAEDDQTLSLRQLLERNDSKLDESSEDSRKIYAYLSELKYWLAWDDELFLKYFKQFYYPGGVQSRDRLEQDE